MSDAMSKAELLSPGLAARDLGLGEVKEMFGPAPTPRQRLEGQGFKFVESEAERGGGGEGDPVEDYFKKFNLERAQEFIADLDGRNYPDASSIKLPDGTSIAFGEYKKIATTIQEAQARGDRRAVEEIIREARRPATPAIAARAPEPQPEQQPAPRAGDWVGELSAGQQEWVSNFLSRLRGDRQVVLQGLQLLIEAIDSGIAVPREISLWPGDKAELRKVVIQVGEGIRHRLALEKAAGDSEIKQDNEGAMVALRFIRDFKSELQRQYPNDLQKQKEVALNLRNKLRKLDALGFSPEDDLVPSGVDIGILLQYLKDVGGGNGGI